MSVSDQEILKSLSEIAEAEQEISLSPEELEQLTELAAYSLDKLSKSKSQPAVSVPTEPIMAAASKAAMLKSSSLCAVVSDAKQVPSQQQIEEGHDKLEDEEKAAEVTEDKEEKKNPWPIAPDGYIPNSVIRALMGYKPPPIQPLPIPWKLKPVPTLPSPLSKASSSPSFLDEPIIWESSSEEEIYEFSDFDFEEFDEDEEDSLMPLEVRRKSVAMAKQQKLRKQSLKYPPIKPMKLPKLKKFGKREIPKTMMEEGEEEEEEKEKMEKKEVPVTSLLIKISKMTWFPSDEEVDKENVVDVLIDLLVKVTPFTHRAVCQALVDIHKEFVIDDRQLDMAVNRLNKQLKHEHAMIRVNAVKTLGGFGLDRKDVILGLLPVLIDKAENVRQEATNTLTKLTGIRDRQGLATLFEKYGILQRYTNRDREVIRELAERQQRKYMEESEKMMAPYRSRPSGFYGKDLGEDEKAPSMLELWVASTKAGLKPDNEDLSKEYSTESLADVIDADFSPWEHTKQRATMDAKHPKTVQFKSSRSLNKFKSYEEMPYYDDMRYFAPQRDRRQSRIQHRTVFREVTDGYMERLIRQKEELAAAMKEQLLRHRSRYRAAVKRGKAAKRFLPNQPDFYKFYAHKRPSHHLKSLVRPQGAGDRVGISDQYRPVHIKEGKLTAQPGTDNDLTIVLDDKWKHHQDTEGSSLFPDTDSGIHSEQVTASSIKQEQLQSISSQIEPSKSQQGDKALKDEKLLQQLHGMYTSTEISLGDSGVGCPSDISSLRIENIDSLPSEMSSFRKKENWRELFQRPTAQQRKQFYEKQRKARELKEMTLPPIVYLHDDVEMTDGVAGQRLLKKLSMIDRKKQHIDEEMHWHVIESMPAKLDVHTNRETTGSTKFGVLNMTWTTAVPSYDRITQLSKQHTMKRALERRKKEAQHSNVTSPEEILDRLHHHWQSRRRSNNLSSLSKLESHYEWSSAPAVIIPHIGEEESLSSLASQDSDSDQKAEKISTLPSVHVPRVKSINNTDTRGRHNTQGEEKLPEINEALKFLTTKEAVPQSN
ncbi:uncharacterized protein [Ptychodera flava]|uniref:uncharacterized protein n=1 Tax=Ptychodera flava TaxID=63121 RepID=UPI003969F50A